MFVGVVTLRYQHTHAYTRTHTHTCTHNGAFYDFANIHTGYVIGLFTLCKAVFFSGLVNNYIYFFNQKWLGTPVLK